MPLCGSSFCGCALTSVPADFAEFGGAFPTIGVAGNGTGVSPWNLTLDDEWAAAVIAALGTEWTNYTPTISQGASANIAKTTAYSRYSRSGPTGKTVTWAFAFNPTASGTAGSNVLLTLPVLATSSLSVFGTGQVFDSSASTRYSGCWENPSTSVIQLVGDWSAGNGWGATPNVAIASGDAIRGMVEYEGV